MIYERIKGWLLRMLEAPTGPPGPPAGTGQTVEVFRAHPNYLKLRLVLWGGGFAIAIVAEIVFIVLEHRFLGDVWKETRWRWLGVSLGYLLLFATLATAMVKYVFIRLDYEMRHYVVTDRSLRIREGVLIIHESTFTFANIQNVLLRQGPLERLMGLANLQVETAGGAGASGSERDNPFKRGHEGILRGVGNAGEVRDQMLDLLKRYRDAGLGDLEDHGRDRSARSGLVPEALDRLREIRDELRTMLQYGPDEQA